MTEERGRVLLALARRAIVLELDGEAPPALHSAPWLDELGATFVTVTVKGELRGCMGSLEARRPLGEDVCENAVAAATRDGRFEPISSEELSEVRLEVTLLGPLEELAFDTEAEALGKIRPGVDGLVLSLGARRGTFIPQMWEKLRTPAEFLMNLKRKAGFAKDFWHEDLRIHRFSAVCWHE